ncbi:hypothetical protein GCK72_009080 [Caenorhabditis remanei]|uniref:Uncharacterized protein n=1 Tax=Caenorhabditis remanei TaxID=31234 RepID=A0A6A5GZ82_CAERE|nr:hypothetical protein GCK72_009080 [Caenorhabditis remanei]KAF1760830.1 hypothetical protein GCK72_009080 [Caenorhabditis remanei]
MNRRSVLVSDGSTDDVECLIECEEPLGEHVGRVGGEEHSYLFFSTTLPIVPSSASTRISMTNESGLGHKSAEHFSIELFVHFVKSICIFGSRPICSSSGYFQKKTTPRRRTAQYRSQLAMLLIVWNIV